jgi:hypothetical protein
MPLRRYAVTPLRRYAALPLCRYAVTPLRRYAVILRENYLKNTTFFLLREISGGLFLYQSSSVNNKEANMS